MEEVTPDVVKEEVTSDIVKVDNISEPVSIGDGDFDSVRELQVSTDTLVKVRAEIGRLHQVITNLTTRANELELESSNSRKELVEKYGLDKTPGQWAVDFEKKEFVLLAPSAPVIP